MEDIEDLFSDRAKNASDTIDELEELKNSWVEVDLARGEDMSAHQIRLNELRSIQRDTPDNNRLVDALAASANREAMHEARFGRGQGMMGLPVGINSGGAIDTGQVYAQSIGSMGATVRQIRLDQIEDIAPRVDEITMEPSLFRESSVWKRFKEAKHDFNIMDMMLYFITKVDVAGGYEDEYLELIEIMDRTGVKLE